jgi:hypothetical protein
MVVLLPPAEPLHQKIGRTIKLDSSFVQNYSSERESTISSCAS